jgi:hypothetical protein
VEFASRAVMKLEFEPGFLGDFFKANLALRGKNESKSEHEGREGKKREVTKPS